MICVNQIFFSQEWDIMNDSCLYCYQWCDDQDALFNEKNRTDSESLRKSEMKNILSDWCDY